MSECTVCTKGDVLFYIYWVPAGLRGYGGTSQPLPVSPLRGFLPGDR